MADAIVKAFAGLPIGELIVNPLVAIATGQAALNQVALDYLDQVGWEGEGDNKKVRTIPVKFDRVIDNGSGVFVKEPVDVSIPLITLVNLPNVSVSDASINFMMEIKMQDSSTTKSEASGSFEAKYGSFFGSAKISGSVSTSKEHTRSTDKTAKYEVNVNAKQMEPTEGMSRVVDMFMQGMLTPMKVGG